MNWASFKQTAPKLARKAEELFDRSGVVLLGTVRKDGGPRISPVEFVIHRGEIYLGMMPKSLKARDLLRDPRCTLHNTVSDRMAKHGEFKLHGQAVNVRNKKERRRYGLALKRKIGWNPEDSGMEYHLFKVALKTAAFFRNEAEVRHLWLWRAGGTMRKYKQTIEGTLTEE